MMRVLAILIAVAAVTSAQASVQISSHPTHNMNCADGVCTPTAKNADLNATDLANMLAASDVKVVTGNGAVTITVSASFSWTSSHRLTLDAYYNVSFRAPVTVAGQGAVTIVTNDGGTGGDLRFFHGGKLDFWDTGSSLIVDGRRFTLINDIRSLAGAVASNPNGAFALANDYDAAHDGTYTGSAVPTPFTGKFDGLGHEVSGFTLKNCDQLSGFFFEVSDSSGLVADVNLSNAKAVSCKANSLGLMAGFSYGTIKNVSVSGSLRISESERDLNSFDVGGLVGGNDGTVANSSADVVIDCRKQGCKIDRQDYGAVGGLVGRSFDRSAIVTSRSSGSISGWNNDIRAGGLVGITEGDVVQSFSNANVAIDGGLVFSSAGGLVGYGQNILDSYATGSVSSKDIGSLGGLVGYVRPDGGGKRAYSVGPVTAPAGAVLGGFVGTDDTSGDFSSACWDLDTSGVTDPGQGAGNIHNDHGITGLSDAELKSGLPAGFNPKIWGQNSDINNGYPYLLANPPPQ